MVKYICINLIGFTNYNPIMVVTKDKEAISVSVPHSVPRDLIGTYVKNTAIELGIDDVKYIGGIGAEDIIAEIEAAGLNIERTNEI